MKPKLAVPISLVGAVSVAEGIRSRDTATVAFGLGLAILGGGGFVAYMQSSRQEQQPAHEGQTDESL